MAHARGIAHLIALAALALSLSNVARAAPDDSATDDALRPRGLAHVANAYLLDADAKLPEYLRLVRQSQRALDDHARRRAQIEADLKSRRRLRRRVGRAATVAGAQPSADELKAGRWTSYPIPLTLTETTNVEYRFWPKRRPYAIAPLTPEQAIQGMFAINSDDVKRIVASRPGKGKPAKALPKE